MDDRRFDSLTRALATPGSRRRYLLAALGVGAVGLAATRGASVAQVLACRQEGEGCTMFAGCCTGLTCVTSPINPNTGFCESGGTDPFEIEQPFGDAAPAATSTPKPTKTPKPTRVPKRVKRDARRPDFKLVVKAKCYPSGGTNPSITATNAGDKPLAIFQLRSRLNPETNGSAPNKWKDVAPNEVLRRGESIVFIREDAEFNPQARIPESGTKFPVQFFKEDAGEAVRVLAEGSGGSTQEVSAECEDPIGATTPSQGPTTGTTERAARSRRRRRGKRRSRKK